MLSAKTFDNGQLSRITICDFIGYTCALSKLQMHCLRVWYYYCHYSEIFYSILGILRQLCSTYYFSGHHNISLLERRPLAKPSHTIRTNEMNSQMREKSEKVRRFEPRRAQVEEARIQQHHISGYSFIKAINRLES